MAEKSRRPDEELKVLGKNTINQNLDVYIWDMDETLILLNSLLKESYAEAFNGLKDVQKGVEIGRMWEKLILQLCDDYFFYEQIENYNKPFLDILNQYDDGRDLSDYDFNQDGLGAPHDDDNKRKLAYRHRVIVQKYILMSVTSVMNRPRIHHKDKRKRFIKFGLKNLLDHETLKLWDQLYETTDAYTDRWLSSARAFLKECLGENKDADSSLALPETSANPTNMTHRHVNVLVTSGSLIPTLVKCMLFRIDNLITHENIYSAWDVGKVQCFRWIKERFDLPNVRFCVIGDGWEECEAAKIMKWPFVKIDPRPGTPYRFPGLTLRTVSHYFSVVYGSLNDENDEE